MIRRCCTGCFYSCNSELISTQCECDACSSNGGIPSLASVTCYVLFLSSLAGIKPCAEFQVLATIYNNVSLLYTTMQCGMIIYNILALFAPVMSPFNYAKYIQQIIIRETQ